MSKKIKGYGDRYDCCKVNIRFKKEVGKIITDRAGKENLSISEYCRRLINSALVTNSDIATKSAIVGFNCSNNDKVTKVTKPVTYKKVRIKTRSI